MGRPRIIGHTPYTGKPLYEPRPFHAKPAFGGYRVYCKRCKTTTHIGVDHLPHDTATRHRCLYDPTKVDER